MKNSKNHPVYQYLINQLPTVEQIKNEYNKEVKDTIKDRLQFVVDCFRSEYCYPENLRRYGNKIKVFAQWLMGLPSAYSVDFENYEILKVGKKLGILKQDAKEREEFKFLENWFNASANKFAQLCKFNKVEF